jgi:hypothetical protein
MERQIASGVSPWLRLPFLLLETERVCFRYRHGRTKNAGLPERRLVRATCCMWEWLRRRAGHRCLPAPRDVRGVGGL